MSTLAQASRLILDVCNRYGMRDGLTGDQRTLARDVAQRRGATSNVLDALDRGELFGDNRVALASMATEDLAIRGFDAEYRPTDLGRQLEDLIDVLNAVS